MAHAATAQLRLNDFSANALTDRHERQYSLLCATGVLGPGPFRVLDLGSGSGVTAVWAARKGWKVTAIDTAPAHMAVLKQHIETKEPRLDIEMLVGNVVDCDGVPDNTFDIVYLKDLLEHVEDFSACLTTVYRKLRLGGLVYIATTNVWCPIQQEYHGVGPYSWYPRWVKDRIREHAMRRKPEIVNYSRNPALHWFSRCTLGKALRETGFQRTWDIYQLIKSPEDLTRRTRVLYPVFRYAPLFPCGLIIADLLMPGLTMVAQR